MKKDGAKNAPDSSVTNAPVAESAPSSRWKNLSKRLKHINALKNNHGKKWKIHPMKSSTAKDIVAKFRKQMQAKFSKHLMQGKHLKGSMRNGSSKGRKNSGKAF